MYKFKEEPKKEELFQPLFVFYFAAVGLNFVWDTLNMAFWYRSVDTFASIYMASIVYSSLLNAALVLAAVFLTMLFLRNWFWIKKPISGNYIVFALSCFLVVVFFEKISFYFIDRFEFLYYLPVYWGISLSALLQLLGVGLGALWFVRRKFFQDKKPPDFF